MDTVKPDSISLSSVVESTSSIRPDLLRLEKTGNFFNSQPVDHSTTAYASNTVADIVRSEGTLLSFYDNTEQFSPSEDFDDPMSGDGDEAGSSSSTDLDEPLDRKSHALNSVLTYGIVLRSPRSDNSTSGSQRASRLLYCMSAESEVDYDRPAFLVSSGSEDDETDMRVLKNRIDSFISWPVAFVAPTAMASVGFYYTGISDRVRCGFCGGVLAQWTPGDDPGREHKRHFPNCIMSVRQSGSSVTSSAPHSVAVGEDICGLHYTLRTLAANATTGNERYEPSMNAYRERFSTFANWPEDKTQRPRDLAAAGLFYLGRTDQVQCFHCGQRLERWDPQDDPWTEHARWSPSCPHIICSKGQQFIEDVLAHFSSPTTSSSSGIEDTSFSSSQTPSVHQSFTSDDEDSEETIVYRALQLSCNRNTIEQALKERRMEFGFSHFRSVEELVEAVNLIENRKKLSKVQVKIDEMAEQSSKTADDLIRENQRLRQERRCKVCLDKDSQMLFQPCGHVACCGDCSQAVHSCPVCRRSIIAKTKLYFA